MANPWDNDPIIRPAGQPAAQGPVYGPPPMPATPVQEAGMRNDAQRVELERQRLILAQQEAADRARERKEKIAQGKAVPVSLQNKLTDNFSIYQSMDNAVRQFNPDFAGNTIIGEAENWAQALHSGIGTPGQREWWSAFRQADNLIRNQMYGSALTETERRAYEQTTISPRMDPKIITANLTRRRDIIKSALSRQARALGAAGYNKEEIAILLGDDPSFLEAPKSPSAGARAPQQRGQQSGGLPTRTQSGATVSNW